MWSTPVLNLKWASPLVTIVRGTMLAPSHIFKSLQFAWGLVVGAISYVPDPQMGCYDFRQGNSIWPPGDMSFLCTITTLQKLWRSQVMFFSEPERKSVKWEKSAEFAWHPVYEGKVSDETNTRGHVYWTASGSFDTSSRLQLLSKRHHNKYSRVRLCHVFLYNMLYVSQMCIRVMLYVFYRWALLGLGLCYP